MRTDAIFIADDETIIDALVTEEDNRALFAKSRDYEAKNNRRIQERAKNIAKRAKIHRIWDDVEDPEGTATRFYNWKVREDEDGYHLFVHRQTERHDALRVRRAIASSAEKIREYAG